MLLKLLKYDMKSVSRLWWLVLPVIAVLTAIDAIAARIFTQSLSDIASLEWGDTSAEVMLVMFMFVAMIICYIVVIGVSVFLAATMIYSYVLVFLRFYKNLFTDEGYLTFTLPAKRSTVLLAKTLNAIFWIFLHTFILAACALLVVLVGIPTVENDFLFGFTLFGGLMKELWRMVIDSCGWNIIIGIELVVLELVTLLAGISIFQFCFTLGSMIVKRGKLFAGIGVYFLVQWVMPFISGAVTYTFYLTFASVFAMIAEMATDFSMGAMYAIVIAMFSLLILLESHLFYFLTRNCLERKLNLA